MNPVEHFFKKVECDHTFVQYMGGNYPFHCKDCDGYFESHPHDEVALVEELLERETYKYDEKQGDVNISYPGGLSGMVVMNKPAIPKLPDNEYSSI